MPPADGTGAPPVAAADATDDAAPHAATGADATAGKSPHERLPSGSYLPMVPTRQTEVDLPGLGALPAPQEHDAGGAEAAAGGLRVYGWRPLMASCSHGQLGALNE